MIEKTDQAVDISEMTPADWQRVHEAVEQFHLSRNTLRTHFRERVGDVKPKSTGTPDVKPKSAGTPKGLLGPREMTAERAADIAAALELK